MNGHVLVTGGVSEAVRREVLYRLAARAELPQDGETEVVAAVMDAGLADLLADFDGRRVFVVSDWAEVVAEASRQGRDGDLEAEMHRGRSTIIAAAQVADVMTQAAQIWRWPLCFGRWVDIEVSGSRWAVVVEMDGGRFSARTCEQVKVEDL